MAVRQTNIPRSVKRQIGRKADLGASQTGFMSMVVRRTWLPIALIAAVLIAGTPNILWSYRYTPVGESPNSTKIFHECLYIGIEGFRDVLPLRGHCPSVKLFPLKLPQFPHPWR